MSLNCVLPSAEHLIIVVLFDVDAPRVLDFGELGGALLVHAVLQIASHRAVALTHLAQHVSLVRLLLVGDPEGVLFVRSVLSLNIRIIRILVMLLEPLSFLRHSLLE